MSEKEKTKVEVPPMQQRKQDQKKVLGIDLTPCLQHKTERDAIQWDPDKWLPDACNSRTAFTATIYAFEDGGWVAQTRKGDEGEKRKITFSLNSSKEKGICMNYPRKAKDYPDLFFPEDMEGFKPDRASDKRGKDCPKNILAAGDNPGHQHHYTKVTTNEEVSEATVVVRCEDYGAYGTIRATVEKEHRKADDDCKPLKRQDGDPAEADTNEVKIPEDYDDNCIADVLADYRKVEPIEDTDNEPAGAGPGDGLTAYEEYRGFIVEEGGVKRHVRTKPNEKDLFIRDARNDQVKRRYLARASDIFEFFRNGSELKIHFIPSEEFWSGDSKNDNLGPPDRNTQIINFNHTSHHLGDQHGIRVVDERKGKLEGRSGFTFTLKRENQPGGTVTPGRVNKIAINSDNIVKRISKEEKDSDRQMARIRKKLKKTMAHELGHSVNVRHHGEARRGFKWNDKKTWSPCGRKGRRSQAQWEGHDRKGGLTSGDVDCVMRYENTLLTKWCHSPQGLVLSCCDHDIYDPNSYEETMGTTFCGSQLGTGVNTSNKEGCDDRNDATVGNCKGQIRVKD